MKKVIRYRATISEVDPEVVLPDLYPTRASAIKAAIDLALHDGFITVAEVPVRKRTFTEWEEVK